jgi:uncharacterized membrane protein
MKGRIRKTFIKTVTWRIVATIVSFLVMFAMTGEIGTATTLTIAIMGSNTLAYFVYELVWDKLAAEKKKKNE